MVKYSGKLLFLFYEQTILLQGRSMLYLLEPYSLCGARGLHEVFPGVMPHIIPQLISEQGVWIAIAPDSFNQVA